MIRSEFSLTIDGLVVPVILFDETEYIGKKDGVFTVYVEVSGGWKTGVFGLLTDDYPKPIIETQPVQWTDGELMLFVPNLDCESVVEAIRFIISGNKQDEAFCDCDKPDEVAAYTDKLKERELPCTIEEGEQAIRGKIWSCIVIMKALGLGKTKNQMLDLLTKYGREAMNGNFG